MNTKHFSAVTGLLLSGSLLFTSCYERGDYNAAPNNNYNNNYNNRGNTTTTNINPGYPAEMDEEFNGPDHYGWTFTDAADSTYGSVSNGSYQLVDYGTTLSSMIVVNTGINTQSNFTVTTRIESNKIMGLVFGASATSNGYAFYIDTSGNYSLYKEGTGTTASTVIIPSTQDSLYAVKDSWNVLEINQTDSTWTGYINGTQVFSMAASSLSGSEFGFKILPGTIGYADYLVVKNY